MGEPHPVESKCVLNVKVEHLGLNASERHKLLVLSGPRYNPDNDELTLSSEKFPYVNQNKKYLSDLLDKIIAEAKVRYICNILSSIFFFHFFKSVFFVPSQDTTENFADIPLDTRHVKSKKKLEFPAEWARPKKSTSA